MDQRDEARRLYILYVLFYLAGFSNMTVKSFDFDVPEQDQMTDEDFSKK